MLPYRRLIAAIDFSPSCRNALREALRLAAAVQGSVTVVHVMDAFLVHELKRALSADEAAIRKEWEERLRQFAEAAEPGGVPVAVMLRVGHPLVELSEACRETGADLLVMGSKGSKNTPHRVGAIAAKCVRKAPVDVLLVREDACGPFRRLVACVDFSENSARALDRAFEWAAQDGAAVDCLHVHQSALAMSLDYGGLVAPMPLETSAQVLAALEAELADFTAAAHAAEPAVRTAMLVTERVNIREAILDHVLTAPADLVVLGTRGRSGLRELLIGTTAEKVVAHAPCSVLAVKPAAGPA